MIREDMTRAGTAPPPQPVAGSPPPDSPSVDENVARFREASARCSSEQFQAAAIEAFGGMPQEQRSAVSALLIDAAARQHITLAWTMPPASDPGSLGQFVAGLRKQGDGLVERLLEDDARHAPGSAADVVLAAMTAAMATRAGGRR